ncbi:MAG: DsbA family protein [Acidobacteriia bacterium]|nr:DsbA family protein [Terriglobia bacterium]
MIRGLGLKKLCGVWVGPAAAFTLLAAALPLTGQSSAYQPVELYLGGQPGAPVKIEVFSDYQCPVCRTFYLDTLKPLLADYAKEDKIDKICVVYHDFPLDMHPFARKAARFALAAQRLSRERWLRVTDALYTEQEKWSQDGNIEAVLAKTLDPTELVRLQNMVANPAIDATINQEIMLAQSRGITSTPTFFIITETGRQNRVIGGVPYAVLKNYLDGLVK